MNENARAKAEQNTTLRVEMNHAERQVLTRTLMSGDLQSVSSLHSLAFPNAVLTALGNSVVTNYYKWQTRGPHAVATLVATVDGEIVGFSLLISRSELRGFLRRNLGTLLCAIIRHPRVIFRMTFLSRLAQGIGSLGTYVFPSEGRTNPGVIRLLAIAVHPKFQRLGIGSRLLQATEACATGSGSLELELTVHPGNYGAVACYLQNGWNRVTQDNKWSGAMRKGLPLARNANPPTASGTEVRRIQAEYHRREAEVPTATYSWARPVNQFFHCQTFRKIITSLVQYNRFPLKDLRVIDIGCGNGSWLLEFCQWGAEPVNLGGIDLDEGRIREARRRLPHADLVCSNAENLIWQDCSIDIVSQFTMMTSILDVEVKRRVASEMLRVLKPGGLILWYDFFMDNPRNPSVRGIKAAEIRRLFPNCSISLKRITLAPPLARIVVPVSWTTASILDKISLLCTHYLGIMVKNSG